MVNHEERNLRGDIRDFIAESRDLQNELRQAQEDGLKFKDDEMLEFKNRLLTLNQRRARIVSMLESEILDLAIMLMDR